MENFSFGDLCTGDFHWRKKYEMITERHISILRHVSQQNSIKIEKVNYNRMLFSTRCHIQISHLPTKNVYSEDARLFIARAKVTIL